MGAGSRPPAAERSRRRGLAWGLVVALIVLAAALAGCGEDERVSVPDLVGMEEAEAKDAVADAGLALGEIEYVPADAGSVEDGQVAAQAPLAGTEVDAGTEVALVVAGVPEETNNADDAEESPPAVGDETGPNPKPPTKKTAPPRRYPTSRVTPAGAK